MKFFWKIYFSFTILFVLSFSIFGTWMIQRTFEHSYQKALDDGEWDNQMFQLAFEMNLNSLGVMYQTDELIPVMGANVTQNLSESGNIYRIYNSEKKLLYESANASAQDMKVLNMLDNEHTSSYEVYRLEPRHGSCMPVAQWSMRKAICWRVLLIFLIFIRNGKAIMTGMWS